MACYVLVPWPKFPLLEKRGKRTRLFNWKQQWKQREYRWSPVIKAEQAVAPKTQFVIGWAWLPRRAKKEGCSCSSSSSFPPEVRLVLRYDTEYVLYLARPVAVLEQPGDPQ